MTIGWLRFDIDINDINIKPALRKKEIRSRLTTWKPYRKSLAANGK
jgi:hypothetical protein